MPPAVAAASIARVPATFPCSKPRALGALIVPATWMIASASRTSCSRASRLERSPSIQLIATRGGCSRLIIKPRSIAVELATDHAPGLQRPFLRAVEEMEKETRAFHMAEEAIADASAFRCSFDEPGYVGNNELAPLVPDDAELWPQRRE